MFNTLNKKNIHTSHFKIEPAFQIHFSHEHVVFKKIEKSLKAFRTINKKSQHFLCVNFVGCAEGQKSKERKRKQNLFGKERKGFEIVRLEIETAKKEGTGNRERLD